MIYSKKIIDLLSGPKLLTYIMPALVMYLVIGTIAQKYIGLYDSTQMFFSSPFFWVGFVPLPGVPILVGLIFVNLAFKLIFKSPWVYRHSGIIMTHIGAALLLIGGLFTMLLSTEGYIDLAPGEQKTYVSDYHTRNLVILNEDNQIVDVFSHNALSVDDTITFANLPVTLNVLETCRNCKIEKRRFAQEHHYGMAQHMQLSPDKPAHDDEENMAGLTFAITGSEHDGVYTTIENVPKYPEIIIDGQMYRFAVRKAQRSLPFTIELLEFKREMHPGTNLAKSYESRVRIIDGEAKWESLISMNEPLRYKGYTFYQSSFLQTPQGDISVLAAVWNVGRSFPYISGILMCLGLIVHLIVRKR
jgi:hypothetical protein